MSWACTVALKGRGARGTGLGKHSAGWLCRWAGKCVLLTLLSAIVVSAVSAQTSLRTENNYREAILEGTINGRPLTPFDFDFLDLNEDGVLDVLDVLLYLSLVETLPPFIAFEGRDSTLNEGDSGFITIRFSKAFSGSVQFTVLTAAETRSAVAGVDFIVGTPVVAADGLSLSIPITILEDVESELMERVVFLIEPGDGYFFEAPLRHTVYIDDNEGIWLGQFITESRIEAFRFDVVQDGAALTGIVAVPDDGTGLFPSGSRGLPISFAGTDFAAGVFSAVVGTDANPIRLSRRNSRFDTGFTRSFTFVSGPTIRIPSAEGPRPGVVKKNNIIVGEMTETIAPTQGFNTLVKQRSGLFILQKLPGVPDILQEAIDTLDQ